MSKPEVEYSPGMTVPVTVGNGPALGAEVGAGAIVGCGAEKVAAEVDGGEYTGGLDDCSDWGCTLCECGDCRFISPEVNPYVSS